MKAGQKQTNFQDSRPQLAEARCECGQLVAKLGSGGVELKCKRCKRLVSIPFSLLTRSEVAVQLCATPPALETPT